MPIIPFEVNCGPYYLELFEGGGNNNSYQLHPEPSDDYVFGYEDCWLTTNFSANPNINGPYFYRSTGRDRVNIFCSLSFLLSGKPLGSNVDILYLYRNDIEGYYYIESIDKIGYGYLASDNLYGPYYFVSYNDTILNYIKCKSNCNRNRNRNYNCNRNRNCNCKN